ncbi:DNA-binding protein [Variovorax sp. GB1P17]|uniref:DNA-binding protein n=1 Tax=Variovorax sp. GB1P17 TaxID=3443740 RepID=UPI003F45A1B9
MNARVQPRRRGVTEQEVWDAADRLLRNQERPTTERVRVELGTGSPNTVQPMLNRWYANLGKRLRLPGEPDTDTDIDTLPAAMVEAMYRVSVSFQQLWAAATEVAIRANLDANRSVVDAQVVASEAC